MEINGINLQNWLRIIGYNGSIPKSIEHLYNPSTVFIWTQLIEKAKPREEVERIRNNIIIERINKSVQQDDFRYPIEEIDVYYRKLRLLDKKETIKRSLEQKNSIIDGLNKSNNLNYLRIECSEKKLQQREQEEYTFKCKSEQLEREIREIENNISIVDRLTPVEMDENVHLNDVEEVLQECAEKLQKLLPKLNKQNLNTTKYNASNKYLNDSRFTSTRIEPKRESLGLLPDHYLSSLDMSQFLLNSTDTASFERKVVELGDPEEFINFVMDSEELHSIFVDILVKYNRSFLWTACNSLENLIVTQLNQQLVEYDRNTSTLQLSRKDLTKLYFEHVYLELKTLKVKNNINMLEQEMVLKKEHLRKLESIENGGEKLNKLFDFAENIGINCGINFIKEQKNNNVKQDKTNKLNIILNKLSKIRENTVMSLNEAENNLDSINKVLKLIVYNKNETVNSVERLNNFFGDLDWMNSLLEEPNVQETQILRTFLMQNKLSHDCFNYSFVKSDDLVLISNMINSFILPEAVFIDIFKAKLKIAELNKLRSSCYNENKKYFDNMVELEAKENYVQSVLERINCVIYSTENSRVMLIPKRIQLIKNLWKELPFRNYISTKFDINKKSLHFYEQQFDQFLSL